MKKFFLLLFTVINIFAYSQNKDNAAWKIRGSIAASGQGMIIWTFPGVKEIQGESLKITATPVFQGNFEHIFPSKLALGFAFSYQNFNFHFVEEPFEATINLDKYSFGLRADYYLIYTPTNNLYIGARASFNYWSGYAEGSVDLVNFDVDYWAWQFIKIMLLPFIQQIDSSLYYKFPFSWYNFPVQFHFGYEPYLTKNLALNFELAIGSPYFALTGLSFKF